MTYLGIDGGGSKTVFLLVDDQDREFLRIQSGPSNWLSVGKNAASNAIREGVTQLGTVTPDVVCGGFAGAGRPEGLSFYRSVLEPLFPSSKVVVESDAVIAYVGAIGLRPGVLLIAGTGSIAIGRQVNGTMVRAGGWGPHFGDEGGGFWIGREAVRTALHSIDRNEGGDFASRIAGHLGVGSVKDVIASWGAGAIAVPEIAGLFPEVVAMWPEEPANRILQEAAFHLRRLTETARARVDVGECAISAAGSVATHSVMQQLIGINFAPALARPEHGAILLAKSSL